MLAVSVDHQIVLLGRNVVGLPHEPVVWMHRATLHLESDIAAVTHTLSHDLLGLGVDRWIAIAAPREIEVTAPPYVSAITARVLA